MNTDQFAGEKMTIFIRKLKIAERFQIAKMDSV